MTAEAPVLLDLYCKGGGASVGYQRAGFRVIGADLKPQPHYPFRFIKADTRDVLADLEPNGWSPLLGERIAAVHASPPCQQFTRARHLRSAQGGRTESLDLVDETRRRLRRTTLPYVIENVEGAPLYGVTVCGSAVGLKVRRHRVFESNVFIPRMPCDHQAQGRPVGVYHVLNDAIPGGGTTAETLAEGQEAMGIDWLPWDELKEAVPPAYTQFIGRVLLGAIQAEGAS